MRHTIILQLLLASVALRAEVFLLGPGSGSPSSPGVALAPTELWSEPVIVNGARNNLKVSLLGTDLAKSFKLLREKYPMAKFAFNAESLLFEVLDGDIRRRVFLVECGKPPYPVMQFSMDFGEIPENFKWPASLPSAPDCTPLQTMEFPERSAFFGSFQSNFPSKTVLSSVHSALLAEGWQPLTREAAKAQLGQSKGEIYVRFNPAEIITISTLDKEDGTSLANIYRKKLR